MVQLEWTERQGQMLPDGSEMSSLRYVHGSITNLYLSGMMYLHLHIAWDGVRACWWSRLMFMLINRCCSLVLLCYTHRGELARQ